MATWPEFTVRYKTRAPLRGRPATLAQGRIKQNVKGAEKRGPFTESSDLILPRATRTCAELVARTALCVCWRCHVLIGSTGVISGGGIKRTERGRLPLFARRTCKFYRARLVPPPEPHTQKPISTLETAAQTPLHKTCAAVSIVEMGFWVCGSGGDSSRARYYLQVSRAKRGSRERTPNQEIKNRVHKYILVPMFRMIPVAVCTKERTAHHGGASGSTTQGRTRHRTALRC